MAAKTWVDFPASAALLLPSNLTADEHANRTNTTINQPCVKPDDVMVDETVLDHRSPTTVDKEVAAYCGSVVEVRLYCYSLDRNY